MKDKNENPIAEVDDMMVKAFEDLSNYTLAATDSVREFSKSLAPKTPWEFAKTLPTKARLNYIAEALKHGYPISVLKQELYAFGGMFIWDETPQGSYYWSNLIPV